jgi:hypothetical protein
MIRSRWLRRTMHLSSNPISFTLLIALFPTSPVRAQEIVLNVTYICNGERIYVYGCDVNDKSDSAWCSVGHPEKPRNGMDSYTNTTRGELKKLLPTCQQPSAQQLAKRKEFDQRLQAQRDADEKKAYDQMHPAETSATPGQRQMTPEQRKINRCVTSGRVMATCTGNALVNGFNQLIGQVAPALAKDLPPGPEISGAFEGAGKWRIDFGDRGATMKCSILDAQSYTYDVKFRDNRAFVTLNTVPKPTVLTVHGDELSGPGPLPIDGHVIVGYTKGGGSSGGTAGHYESQQVTTHQELTPLEATQYAGQSGLTQNGQTYDMATTSTQSTYVPGSAPVASGPQPIYGPKRATCVAPALSSKNAGTSSTVAATGMLKSLFNNGDSGPPTPPGVRMHGIFAASTGFSVEFFPESAVLGCGPDAARAYPYTVIADGTRSAIKIDAPDHPLLLAIRGDGSLDPGTLAPYQVHGRTITGQSGDNFSFAPLEMTCDLAVLTPSQAVPANGGVSPVVRASTGAGAAPMPAGNSTLSIASGFAPQPNAPNPLANHPYVLLRSSFDDTIRQSGVTVPPGVTPFKYFGVSCANRTQDCQSILTAIKANVASAVKADANGSATVPNLAVGTYYLMISTRYNNQGLIWTQGVQINQGQNSITLDTRNATPVN